jgi:hypothetical protein
MTGSGECVLPDGAAETCWFAIGMRFFPQFPQNFTLSVTAVPQFGQKGTRVASDFVI